MGEKMHLWDKTLRICSKCKAKLHFDENEVEKPCPSCENRVWFFQFERIPIPEAPPRPKPTDFWSHPQTYITLGICGVLSLIGLIAVLKTMILASVCAMICVGFAAFAMLRHAETRQLEIQLENASQQAEYAKLQHYRVDIVSKQYVALLKTGNTRIEHYYKEIYKKAEKEKQEARDLRDAAEFDRKKVETVEDRIYSISERHIADHVQWVANKLRADPDNYQRNKIQLSKAFATVESVGYEIPKGLRDSSMADLKQAYLQKVKEQGLKDEQRLIKQQMRDEEKARKEREAAILEAESKEMEIQGRLEALLLEQQGTFNEEIEQLKQALEEAQAGSERAKSMAQQTRMGHVYILSNIGSFGENVFKVGMTRRLEPLDRVIELGDASVPFCFDVHAMIKCDDAPLLEKTLHHHLAKYRVNRVNFRKEYFRVPLEEILNSVELHHGIVEYIAEPEALEYRETLSVTEEDLMEIENDLQEMGVAFGDEEDA